MGPLKCHDNINQQTENAHAGQPEKGAASDQTKDPGTEAELNLQTTITKGFVHRPTRTISLF